MADRGAEQPGLNAPPRLGAGRRVSAALRARVGPLALRVGRFLAAYFRQNDPTFGVAFTPALIMSALLFVRNPASNYIFDEQEALLANPYVNGRSLGFWDAFKRDFWGLPPERSIGSYRPIPNLIWRLLWHVSEAPWLHHWVNVIVHAANAALLAVITWRMTRQRGLAWLAGAIFLSCAVLTETVSGVVGIADVLGGLGVLLAVAALALPLAVMPFAVFAACSFGLFAKESAIVALPLVAFAALVSADTLHVKPLRITRALAASLAAVAALVCYTYLRRHWFPVALSDEFSAHLAPDRPLIERGFYAFLRWFQQPKLPQDPINNPLSVTDFAHRTAGALRIYLSGLGQVLVPWRLSGDYSFPQEPVPERVVSPVSVAGALMLVLPIVLALVIWLRALWLGERARPASWVLAIALFWVPVAYFPHSNIPIVLPTVRAERFWYLPAMGAALVIAIAFVRLRERFPGRKVTALIVLFLGFQAVRARDHALDYTDDLTFWRATRRAAPRSAKAHLNYSVMIGARGHLPERLEASKRALTLAPLWPMAHVYYADTLCRMRQSDAAWPHYVRGFELGPNDPNLIALGLQCLWDEKSIEKHREELLRLASAHPGSWLAYLGTDIVHNGAKYGGVEKKYRPRGYDEGPKVP